MVPTIAISKTEPATIIVFISYVFLPFLCIVCYQFLPNIILKQEPQRLFQPPGKSFWAYSYRQKWSKATKPLSYTLQYPSAIFQTPFSYKNISSNILSITTMAYALQIYTIRGPSSRGFDDFLCVSMSMNCFGSRVGGQARPGYVLFVDAANDIGVPLLYVERIVHTLLIEGYNVTSRGGIRRRRPVNAPIAAAAGNSPTGVA